MNRFFTDRRPETLSVDDLKDLRYLECVIKVLKLMYFIFFVSCENRKWESAVILRLVFVDYFE